MLSFRWENDVLYVTKVKDCSFEKATEIIIKDINLYGVLKAPVEVFNHYSGLTSSFHQDSSLGVVDGDRLNRKHKVIFNKRENAMKVKNVNIPLDFGLEYG